MEKLHAKVTCSYKWTGPNWLVPDLTFRKYVEPARLSYVDTEKTRELEVWIDAEKNKSNTFKDNFRELLNSFSDPIMVLKQEGVVLVANKAVCTFLGVASEELIGKHFEDLKFLIRKRKC